jgi:hypothetical protein
MAVELLTGCGMILESEKRSLIGMEVSRILELLRGTIIAQTVATTPAVPQLPRVDVHSRESASAVKHDCVGENLIQLGRV